MLASDLCPVCGMKAISEVPSVEHHKMYFHFCSQQCRETFLAHPNLYSARLGKERKEILKRRTMRLTEPLDNDVEELLVPYLKEMMGVEEVTVKGDKVHITYDLLQVKEIQIEKALIEIGLQLGDGWLERLCRSWVHDCEEVELDNLSSPQAACCNRAPPRA